MKRLLVPIDGSKGAARALAYAIARAKETKAEIHVLHVVPPMSYDELRIYVERDDIATIRRQANQRLLGDALAELKSAGIPHVGHLLDGDAAQTIAQFAESQAMDEIILGSRGMGALGGLMLGSVSSRVAHLAKVPVTLVR
jgi:nucleotide-binding universal stress UspA family protein